ncbi:unnamed protein product, partial [Brassica oleracea var. botrytis]
MFRKLYSPNCAKRFLSLFFCCIVKFKLCQTFSLVSYSLKL